MKKKSRLFVIVLIILSIIYISSQMFRQKTETIKAVSQTANNSIIADGYIVRDEKTIDIKNNKNIEIIATNGEKISKGTKIAFSYKDTGVAALNTELANIKSRISVLENAIGATTNIDETNKLDELIRLEIIRITSLNNSSLILGENYQKSINNIQSLMLRRNQGNIDTNSLNKELETITKKAAELNIEINKKSNIIYSDYSGYFSDNVDGYEDVLKADNIKNISYADVEKLHETQAKIQEDKCKVINDFSWYFVTNISKEQADTISNYKNIKIALNSENSEKFKAKIYKMQKNTDGTALLIIECSAMNEKISTIRTAQIEIILQSFDGIKIPREALRVSDGVEGVYILVGNIAKFKKIDILYFDDEYYIIRADKTTTDSVLIGDEIVVKSIDIQDRQIAT